MGAGLDKWPSIWATVGPAGRLNMFWSRPNRLWWPTSFATRNNTNTKYILQIHTWTQIQIHFRQKSFTILRRQLFCLFSNTLSIAVAEWATAAYKWISYSDGFPDSRDLTKVIEIAQRLRRWDHPFKCVFFSYTQRLEYESKINYFVIRNQSKCALYPFVIRIIIFVMIRRYI